MKHCVFKVSAVVFTAVTSVLQAHASDIAITEAWSRATPGAAPVGVVYMTISDTGVPDILSGEATTPIAERAQLHETKSADGVTAMNPVISLPVATKETVKLVPGSYHFMLMGLKLPLKAGDHFPLTLHFQHAGEITASVAVQSLGATSPSKNMPGMDMGKMQ